MIYRAGVGVQHFRRKHQLSYLLSWDFC